MLWCYHNMCCVIYRAHTGTKKPTVKVSEVASFLQWQIELGGKWHLGNPVQRCAPIWVSCHPCKACDKHCHTAEAAFSHLLCTCVNHCTRQSIKCLVLDIRSFATSMLGLVLWCTGWKQAIILKRGMDVQTDCVCHDFLWIRFRYFMGKAFYWMTFSDRGDGKRLQFN